MSGTSIRRLQNSRLGNSLGLLLLMLSTACSTALDPVRFDGARYGMSESDLALQLDAVSSPELRFFPAEGVASDMRVALFRGRHPHPDYYVVYRDQKLHSVLTAGRMGDHATQKAGWSRAALKELSVHLREQRVPLAWSELKAVDDAELLTTPNPTTVTLVTILGMPMVWPVLVLVPIMWPVSNSMFAARQERRQALWNLLLGLPVRAEAAEVVAALGEPTRKQAHPEDPAVEIWLYAERDDEHLTRGIRLGLVAGRVLWIEFEYWAVPAKPVPLAAQLESGTPR
mgnify:FL=1|tara:strand:+ start:17445 stop:18299 length:855 start_codon:yes stop_codon:yes gene_type:complete